MKPVVDQLVAQGYAVRKVDVAREPELAQRYGVRAIPCFVMTAGGRESGRLVGLASLGELQQLCASGREPRASQPQIQFVSNGSSRPASIPIPSVQSNTPYTPSQNLAPGRDLSGGTGRTAAGVAAARQDELSTKLLAASVRIRIEDAKGYSTGSGTMIDARNGWVLVLTCGHLFRECKGDMKGVKIEVDVFGDAPAEKVPAELVYYSVPTASADDLTPDLALVKMRLTSPVAIARVAPAAYAVAKGARAMSVGCNNGDRPTLKNSQITSLNRCVGPYVLASGLPVQGRSGGGLFSSDGYVVGVCNAAMAPDEGLYLNLAAIQEQLDRVGLAFVFRPDAAKMAATPVSNHGPSMAAEMPSPADTVKWTEAPGRPAAAAPRNDVSRSDAPRSDASRNELTADERATLEEIDRRKRDGAEVIFIIRSRTNPSAPSEIIVLDKASPAFVDRLTAPTSAPSGRVETKAAAPGEPFNPRPAARAPAVPLSRNVPSQDATASGENEWRPHWLQTEYQGS
jgi:hypothetical protein